jgi:predicted MFS family arabinose efflux permease
MVGQVRKRGRGMKIHWAWVVLGSSFITLFINYSVRIGAYPVLLPEMIRDLQITKAQAGMIKSAFSITYLVFSPVMGWFTDRIGGRKVISFFCLFLGGGTFLCDRNAAVVFWIGRIFHFLDRFSYKRVKKTGRTLKRRN